MSRSPEDEALAALTVRAVLMMPDGSPADFAAVYAPDAVNREAVAEPPECRVGGPAAFHATAQWLRAAFSDLDFTVDAVVVDADTVVTLGTMAGRHTGTFTLWRPDGGLDRALPPTGRSFRVKYAHAMRMRDGQIVEHWAYRDDLGQARQLGWMPPSPVHLVRSAVATAALRRRLRQADPVVDGDG
ncbi:ester cyclase [Tersicoccus sp. MR15.9]|uniref:ester cyclase n=1 Tax=Tersicoccus mangrovi TaxID=3121635 RepID=UPI002FE5D8CF